MSGTKTRVFVYGTLKKDHCNHGALEEADFLGRCYIEAPHMMLNLGWYPGLVDLEGENRKVFGEVYQISEDTLYTLDCIEGHPTYYKRRKVVTPWKNAWVYYLPPEYAYEADFSRCDDGLWEPTDEEMEFARGC